jgi:tetratricopeptide (TPR) repeat protein
MKKIVFLFCMVGLVKLHAQKTLPAQQKAVPTQQAPNQAIDVNLAVYKNAMGLQDYVTAIQALHYIIATSPNGAAYADTLAILYAQTGQFVQAGILADVQLKTNGYSDIRMEIKAASAKKLNNAPAAIDDYTILYEKTAKPVYAFEKLQLQYNIKRMTEANGTATALLSAIPATDSTTAQVAKLDGKTAQQVNFRSAVLNYQGLTYIDLKQKQAAIKAFEAALKLDPDYEQAKNNMAIAKQML